MGCHFLLQGIFPSDQRLNPGLLHCRLWWWKPLFLLGETPQYFLMFYAVKEGCQNPHFSRPCPPPGIWLYTRYMRTMGAYYSPKLNPSTSTMIKMGWRSALWAPQPSIWMLWRQSHLPMDCGSLPLNNRKTWRLSQLSNLSSLVSWSTKWG